MTEREILKLALEALSPWAGEDANHTEQYSAYHAIREALANYNPTSDHCMMENAQGDLERIKLVQTGVGIGKPEQEPFGWLYSLIVEGTVVNEKFTGVNWDTKYEPFGRHGVDHGGKVTKTPLYTKEQL